MESPDCLIGETETCPACGTAVAVPPQQQEPAPVPEEPSVPFAADESGPPVPFPQDAEDAAQSPADTADLDLQTDDISAEDTEVAEPAEPPAPFAADESGPPVPFPQDAEDAAQSPADTADLDLQTDDISAEDTKVAEPAEPPAPFAADQDEPSPAAVTEPETPGQDDDDIDLGIFGDAPSAETEIEEEEKAAAASSTSPATQDASSMPPASPPQKADDDMPPPSPVQTQPDWGILDHAKAAEGEVSEDDHADVGAYAIGPQEEPAPADDEVSEEDTVQQIDIGKLAAGAGMQPPAAPAGNDDGMFIPGLDGSDDSQAQSPPPPTGQAAATDVFVPGMPTDEELNKPSTPASDQLPPPTPTTTETPVQASAKVKVLVPKPLFVLGGLDVLVGVLLAAVVVILGLIRGGVLSPDSYSMLNGLGEIRSMGMIAFNAAMLLLTGSGLMLLRRYGKLIGWFWVLAVFIILGVEIFLRLQAGSASVDDILQPKPLALIGGSILLAAMNACALFAYSRRFNRKPAQSTQAPAES
jgi:hypothetical protein